MRTGKPGQPPLPHKNRGRRYRSPGLKVSPCNEISDNALIFSSAGVPPPTTRTLASPERSHLSTVPTGSVCERTLSQTALPATLYYSYRSGVPSIQGLVPDDLR